MYGKTILTVLVAVALIGLATPAAADHTPKSVEYAVGNHTGEIFVAAVVLCEDIEGSGSPGIGGACVVTCSGEGDLCTITVMDDNQGHWAFNWRCEASSGDTTPAESPATIPNNCPNKHVTVFVQVGSTTGTISANKE